MNENPKDRNGISSLPTSARKLISVVVPAYNEAPGLPEFHRRLGNVLDALALNSEVVYVNDGSTDETMAVMETMRSRDQRVSILDLSRNFGKEIAMTAGLDYAQGDAVVVIDADLQDPPELIPEFIRHWEEGYDVVYATRTVREGETIIKKATARAFYRLMQNVGRVNIPDNTGDYRLLSRRAVDSLGQLREHHRFMKGLFAWIGYPQKSITYRRAPRYDGTTKWNYWRLWNFALEGITSFTTTPLKLATYLGLAAALGAFLYGSYFLIRTLAFGNPVPGYPSLLVIILFMGGTQLMAIGIIGEYLGRMFNETKRRPLYFIKYYEPSAARKGQETLKTYRSENTGGQ